MSEILGLWDWDFKRTMTHTLSALMENVDNMQEPMSNVSREMETSKKESKENAWNWNHCKRNEECLWCIHQ